MLMSSQEATSNLSFLASLPPHGEICSKHPAGTSDDKTDQFQGTLYRLTHFFCASFFCLLVNVLYLTIFVQYPQSGFNPVVYILGRLAQHELGSGSERRGEEY